MAASMPWRPVDTHETFWRTLLTFSFTRIVIAVVLVAYFAFGFKDNAALEGRVETWQIFHLYLGLSLAFVILAGRLRSRFYVQLVSQVMVDLIVMGVLYAAAGGAKSGLAILFLFPLAGAAILARLTLALFFASIVALFMLLDSGYRILNFTSDVTVSQAGLYGAAFLAAVFMINRLAAKLIRQEALATRRGIDLQVQEAVNRLIIADVGDGILVVGESGQIYTANPAAERMLGLSMPYFGRLRRLTDLNTLMPIAEAFFTWRLWPADSGQQPRDATLVVIKPAHELAPQSSRRSGRRELATHLRLRFANAQTDGLSDDRTVIFLQNVTEIENQAQQLKLASMGRLTASIAHEVRNPLAAISYASALLTEEVLTPAQGRLLQIVGDNVSRLDRMIEDILKLSRKAQPHDEPLALANFFAETVEDFCETHGVAREIVQLGDMRGHTVRFDPLHLREVISNLLANAIRYASGKPGSIQIFSLSGPAERIELHVHDDGAPLTTEVRAHLFEPFYTTSSKGTGLGLYLARELCRNNGGMIDYEYRSELADGTQGAIGGRFVITLSAAGADKLPAETKVF